MNKFILYHQAPHSWFFCLRDDWDISYEEYREIVFNDWDEPES